MEPTINLLGLEKLNRRLFYDHPDPIYSFDLKGRFFTLNEAVCRLTGFSREELTGNSFEGLVHPDFLKQTKEFFQRAVSGEQQRYDSAILTKSGQVIYLDVSNQPLKVGNVVVGVFGIAKDITENRRREQALEKATEDLRLHNEQLELFRRIIAHDLRSPIAKIMGVSKFLQKSDVPPETVQEMLNYALKMAGEMDTLIRDLNQVISLETKGADTREWVDVGALVKASLKEFREDIKKAGATISLEIEPALKIYTTKAFLFSIFKNLLSNAIKYRSAERALIVTVRSQIIKNQVCLSVIDNGMGMDMKKVSADLFKMFKRFHPAIEGKGLGLYLVREQARLLGGRVEVDSQLGKGSVFKVYLPLTKNDDTGKSFTDR